MSNQAKTSLGTAWRTLLRFSTEIRGVAAIEFAFIAPLMLAFYFLTMELSQGIDTSKKVGRVASLVGDLVTQSPFMTRDELDAIMKIGEAVLQPYNRTRPEITITAIQITEEDAPKAVVVWSRQFAKGSYKRAEQPGSQTSVPETLKSPGAFLIRAQTDLDYTPVIIWTETGKRAAGLMAAFDKIAMGEHYYLRPRVGRTIACNDC